MCPLVKWQDRVMALTVGRESDVQETVTYWQTSLTMLLINFIVLWGGNSEMFTFAYLRADYRPSLFPTVCWLYFLGLEFPEYIFWAFVHRGKKSSVMGNKEMFKTKEMLKNIHWRSINNQNTESGPGLCTSKERVTGRIRKWALKDQGQLTWIKKKNPPA